MGDLREALRGTAERIAEYREGLAAAGVSPAASRADVRGSLGELREGPTPLGSVIDELVEAATPGLMASAGPPVLRVRHGRLDRRGARRRRPGGRMGPVRLQRGDVARGTRVRGRRRGMVEGDPRASDVGVGRIRDGRAGREHRRPRVGSLVGAPRPGLGRGAGRSARRTAGASRRRRGAPRDDRPGRAPARARRRLPGGRSRSHRRRDGHRCVGRRPRGRGRRSDDRLCAGRQRQHGCLRRPRRGVGVGPRRRGLAPRRRRVRALGRGEPAHVRAGARHRAGRFMGMRRPQVAQRPVRRRLCVLRPSRGPRDRAGVHGGVPDRPGRRARVRRRRLRAGVVTAGARLRDLGGAALARAVGRGRPRRSLLHAGPPFRRPARRSSTASRS